MLTPLAEIQDKADQLEQANPEAHFIPHVLANQYAVQEIYGLAQEIYEREVPNAGVLAVQVIADITGGVKPMTAGLFYY